MSKLVIVESPSKAKTISKILGSDYKVIASNGHIIDLPKNKLGVDIDNNFKPEYIVDKKKDKVIKELKDSAKKASKIFLASDQDREGEFISYSVSNVLSLPDDKIRIEFNEITSEAIKEAIKNPRKIDINKVNSQQTRRILDRLVGYGISPLLWKKLGYGTSAGRVQSVALKLICELEDEIKKFIPEKYYSVTGVFNKKEFTLYKINNEKIDKLKDESILEKIKKEKGNNFKLLVNKITKKKATSPLPFKTSTLQQSASSELSYSPSRSMKIAQTLYSGIDIDGTLVGLITYMRTDSVRISNEAKTKAKNYIKKTYGDNYHKESFNKKGKNSQEAHEAIRPSNIAKNPDSIKKYLTKDQYNLYKLIYNRFLASQMSDLEYDQLEVVFNNNNISFRKLFNKITFDGYSKVIKVSDEYSDHLPTFKDPEELQNIEIKDSETKPPARLSEASLIKKLEKEGIGRPATYTSIVDTLKTREYVVLENKRFSPTNLGYSVKDILSENFKEIMNVKFTSNMENNLDSIEQGKIEWSDILKKFNISLEKDIANFKNKSNEEKKPIKSDVSCKECSKEMNLKRGRFGPYLECENGHKKSVSDKVLDYEEEKNGFVKLKDIIKEIDSKKNGYKTDVKIDGVDAILKEGPYGHYLEAKVNDKIVRESIPKKIKIEFNKTVIELKDSIESFKKQIKDIEDKADKCEKCGSDMKAKSGKWGFFLSCSGYPKCKNIRKLVKDALK